MKRRTYDQYGRTRPLDVFATCQRCHGPIKHDQRSTAVHCRGGGPVVGWTHQNCPPTLAVVQ